MAVIYGNNSSDVTSRHTREPFDTERGSSASGGGRKAGGEAPLGSKRQSFHPEGGEDGSAKRAKASKARREAMADQRQAAAIYRWHESRAVENGIALDDLKKLAGRGVCFCGWTQIAEHETALMRVQSETGWRSYISGTQKCGLRWVCPICTHARGEEDRKAINDGVAAAREKRGLHPVMMTLTTRHHAREAALDVLGGVIAAEQRLKRLKVWTRLSARLAGYVRVTEWTHGKSGHHPHFHTVLLVEASTQVEAIKQVETLRGAYMRQLEAAGRDGTSKAAWERSFHVQGAAAVAQYITKWGMAEELTGATSKNSMTPWQLLRRSRTAETEDERHRAASVWWEIMQATKGRAQLFKSEGWKILVEEWRAKQELEEPAPEPEMVDHFGVRDRGGESTPAWKQARSKTLVIRETAEAHDDLSIAQALVRQALANGETDDAILSEKGEDDDACELFDDDDPREAEQRIENPQLPCRRFDSASGHLSRAPPKRPQAQGSRPAQAQP